MHLELAGERDHIDHGLDDVDITALQLATSERDVRVRIGLPAAGEPEQAIRPAHKLSFGRIDKLDAPNHHGDIWLARPCTSRYRGNRPVFCNRNNSVWWNGNRPAIALNIESVASLQHTV